MVDIGVISWYYNIAMKYIPTLIRFEETQYHALKQEASQKRKSLSAVIREKIDEKSQTSKSQEEVEKLMQEIRANAKKNAPYLKGIDGTKIIREMRYNAKW